MRLGKRLTHGLHGDMDARKQQQTVPSDYKQARERSDRKRERRQRGMEVLRINKTFHNASFGGCWSHSCLIFLHSKRVAHVSWLSLLGRAAIGVSSAQ